MQMERGSRALRYRLGALVVLALLSGLVAVVASRSSGPSHSRSQGVLRMRDQHADLARPRGETPAVQAEASSTVVVVPLPFPTPIQGGSVGDPSALPGPPMEVRGIVTMDQHGVAGAQIVIRSVAAGAESSLGEALTGSDGTFSLTVPRKRQVVIEVRYRSTATAYSVIYGTRVGSPSTVHIRLKPQASVTGRVFTSERVPAQGIPVTCKVPLRPTGFEPVTRLPWEWEQQDDLSPVDTRTCVTDSDGTFGFHALPTGLVVLEVGGVSEPVLAPASVPIDLIVPDVATVSGTVASVAGSPIADARLVFRSVLEDGRSGRSEVTTDSSGAFRVRCQGPGTLASVAVNGHPVASTALELSVGADVKWDVLVSAASVQGRVSTPRGAAGLGILVSWRSENGERGDCVVVQDGHFRFFPVSPGAITLEASMSGWSTRETVRVPHGPDVVQVDLTLQPCSSVVGLVVGAMSDQTGMGEAILFAEGMKWRTRVDGTGRFAFEGIPPFSDAHVSFGRARSRSFYVGPHELVTVTLKLPPRATIFGTVTSVQGMPLAGATVHASRHLTGLGSALRHPYGGHTTVADSKGQYVLELEPGDLVCLLANHPSHAPGLVANFRVPAAGETRQVAIALEEGVETTGRFVDAQDRPVGGGVVEIRPVGPLRIRTGSIGLDSRVRVQASGWFRFVGEPEGVYELVGRTPTSHTEPLRVNVGARELTLRLENTGFVQGIVVDANGVAVEGCGIMALQGKWRSAAVRAGPGGTFRIDNLPSGACTLMVVDGAYIGQLEVFAGQSGIVVHARKDS